MYNQIGNAYIIISESPFENWATYEYLDDHQGKSRDPEMSVNPGPQNTFSSFKLSFYMYNLWPIFFKYGTNVPFCTIPQTIYLAKIIQKQLPTFVGERRPQCLDFGVLRSFFKFPLHLYDHGRGRSYENVKSIRDSLAHLLLYLLIFLLRTINIVI